jgi:1,4-alpha-glucan branching enzyme
MISDTDLFLFNEGRHHRLWEKMGAHPATVEGVAGAHFAVWAPDAASVAVVGDWNGWDREAAPLQPRGTSGIWEGFVPGAVRGTRYKFHVASRHGGYRADKADPFAIRSETPPATASIVWDLDYRWGDESWMAGRAERQGLRAPMSVYEVHLGSWRRPGGKDRQPGFREMAEPLADYVREMNFTHVELLPVMEHPFYGSWGYQVTGYFSPTGRHGTPQDLMHLIDVLHGRGVGVILDWVPSHFPSDEHGLGYFDGTHLFEHADRRKGFHPDWNSLIFNYGRNEVRSFLVSSALFWLDRYHADGLRVDAVASMLYLDYSRKAGEWIPNRYGGRENLEAIELLRQVNTAAYEASPGVETIAEESTSWPMVSRPTWLGGLGFGLKWDMGWMHDTLDYFVKDPVHRKFHHDRLTFRLLYAFSENFVLSLSHDEVVHLKGSLLSRMPGDDWRKRANLRLLLGYMHAQPGKKLLFMGGEFGQWREWNHEGELDWELLDDPAHEGLRRWTADLNRFHREEPAMHELDADPAGFEWIDCNDSEQSAVTLLRKAASTPRTVVIACNFTPLPRRGYRIGVPFAGRWEEALNGDAEIYGGSGLGNLGGLEAEEIPTHGRPWSIEALLPPLSMVAFVHPGE